MYYKYRLQKKQVSTDNGQTWTDVSPLETRKGDVIGTYGTYSECMSGTPSPYASQYLTIESLEDVNTVYFKSRQTSNTKTISASTDNGQTWSAYTSSTDGTVIAELNTGEKVLIKALNLSYGETNYYNAFSASKRFEVYGNVMSLISGDTFENATILSASNSLSNIFNFAYKLISAENLILPATTLAENCYSNMFWGCNNLTTAPELPATTLAGGCYGLMFAGCTSLSSAPVLPATTLAENCYSNMFAGCTSLTTAPELPATTLAGGCYQSMFDGCTSLNYIKCLATDNSIWGCTSNWVSSVSSSGTFVKAASMTGWETGSSGIPTGWTVQNA